MTPGTQSSGRAVFKGAIQGTSLYFLPLLAQRIAGIALLPFTTQVLAPSDFGMLSLLEQVSSVLGILLCGNFASALGYFYYQKGNEQNRPTVVGTSIFGALFLGSAAALLCWPLAAPLARFVFRTPAALTYLPLVFIMLPLSFLLEGLFGWLRVVDRPAVFAIGSGIKLIVTVAGIVLLVIVLRMRVLGYLYTTLIALVVTIMALAAHYLRHSRPLLSYSLFLKMIRFALPLGLSGSAMFLINFGDQFVLNQYRSLSEVGIYSLAYRIGMMVSFAYSAFNSYWSAQVFQILRRDDADHLFSRLFTYVLVGLTFCSVGLVVCSQPALHLLAKPYRAAGPLIPLVVGAYLVRSIGDFVRCLFLVEGKPGYDALCNWIGAVVCIAGYFILIPRFGMWGAAIATDLTFVVIAAVSIFWTYRFHPYRVEWQRLGKLAIAGATALLPYFLVPVSTLFGQIAWAVVGLALLPGVLGILGFLTPGELETLRSLPKRLRRSPAA